MPDSAQLKKLKWSCRRGMLELDVILLGFLEKSFVSLDDAQQQVFIDMLELPDPELFSALMGYQTLEQSDFAALVQLIRADNSTF